MSDSVRYRTFAEEELAFFWDPRNWLEIRSRFHDKRFGGDVRDAVIHLDNEGGLGFLKWAAAEGTWALTDRGKTWCRNMISSAKIQAARAWKAPAEDLARLREEDAVRRESLAREKRGKKRRVGSDPLPADDPGEGPEAIPIAAVNADLAAAFPSTKADEEIEVEAPEDELARLAAEQAEDS